MRRAEAISRKAIESRTARRADLIQKPCGDEDVGRRSGDRASRQALRKPGDGGVHNGPVRPAASSAIDCATMLPVTRICVVSTGRPAGEAVNQTYGQLLS